MKLRLHKKKRVQCAKHKWQDKTLQLSSLIQKACMHTKNVKFNLKNVVDF